MTDSHIKAFYNVSNILRLVSASSGSHLPELKSALKTWEKTLKTMPDLQEFIEMNYEELRRIKFALKQLHRQDPALTGYHDRIYNNKLKFPASPPHPITTIFGEFIKGITYFAHHNLGIPVSQPMYHRLHSCGPGDEAFRELYLQCTPNMDRHRRNEIKHQIETCYIERLIYDQYYINHTLFFPEKADDSPKQNSGHAHRIDVTNEDFRTCFPNISIEVELEFDFWWPSKATITRYLHNNLISTEVYEKTLTIAPTGNRHYIDAVDATRTTATAKYVKVNHFAQPNKWLRVET